MLIDMQSFTCICIIHQLLSYDGFKSRTRKLQADVQSAVELNGVLVYNVKRKGKTREAEQDCPWPTSSWYG